MTIVLLVGKNGYSVKDSSSFWGGVSKVKINDTVLPDFPLNKFFD